MLAACCSMAALTLVGALGAPAMAQDVAVGEKATAAFPSELVNWTPAADNPLFTGAGPGHWDAKIRERGWILREGDVYHLWYTGYEGPTAKVHRLGYATSPDGLHWTRWPGNPLVADAWVEDMMVIHHDGTYYMFAEGLDDQAQLLTSSDRVHWKREGTLDIRTADGQPLKPGPFGTPTAWLENETWYLFYERMDAAVWLATSKDLKRWTNVQDEPVMRLGPAEYDRQMIAFNQIIKHEGRYYASYHGTGDTMKPRKWTSNLATSTDLIHWQKYSGNPIVPGDRSSGIFVNDGRQLRFYTMHDHMDVFFPKQP